MSVHTTYKTEPLEAWARMREIRRQRIPDLWEGHRQGKMMVMRIGETMSPLLAAFGPYVSRIFGPYFGPAMKDTGLLVKFHEAAESREIPGGEFCSAMHHQLGQVILGLSTLSPLDKQQSPIDFIFQTAICQPQKKMAQLAGSILNLPTFIIDIPYCDEPSQTSFPSPKTKEYLVGQMEEAIEWLAKVTGRGFDDELLMAGVVNEWECSVLMAEICTTCQAVPVPLDYLQLRELSYISGMLHNDERAVEFNRMLLDELKDRVARGISAHGVETARILFESEDIFFAMHRLMSIPRKYGAIFMGDRGPALRGAWDFDEEGRMRPAPHFHELGRHLKSRRDALELLAELSLDRSIIPHQLHLHMRPSMTWHKAKDWKSDAVVMLLDIGCRAISMSFPEVKLFLREHGMPAFTFEGSSSDPRYYDEGRVLEQLETFLESLGLTPLPTEARD